MCVMVYLLVVGPNPTAIIITSHLRTPTPTPIHVFVPIFRIFSGHELVLVLIHIPSVLFPAIQRRSAFAGSGGGAPGVAAAQVEVGSNDGRKLGVPGEPVTGDWSTVRQVERGGECGTWHCFLKQANSTCIWFSFLLHVRGEMRGTLTRERFGSTSPAKTSFILFEKLIRHH